MIQKGTSPGDKQIRPKSLVWNVKVKVVVPKFKNKGIGGFEFREWIFSVILN